MSEYSEYLKLGGMINTLSGTPVGLSFNVTIVFAKSYGRTA